MTNAEQLFTNFGYVIQRPTTDKTYFLVKQFELGTKMIWLKLKKTPELSVTFNNKKADLTSQEYNAFYELLEENGYSEYIEVD